MLPLFVVMVHLFIRTTAGVLSIQIKIENEISIFKAPQMIYIKADKIHELTALEDNTVVYCIHALRDIDGSGDIIAPDMIPMGSNPFDYAQKTTND